MSMFDGFKFRSVSSPIHLIDPRAKFLYVCVLFAVTVMFNQLVPLLILFVIQIPFVIIAGVEREWLRSMRGSALFAVIIFVMNVLSLYFYGGYPTFALILERSITITVRFVVLVESFSVFFLTTSPDLLGLALEQSRVPYELCFAFTTAVRFVPVLADEAQTIMDAQKARGLELEGGNFMKRIRNYIPILIHPKPHLNKPFLFAFICWKLFRFFLPFSWFPCPGNIRKGFGGPLLKKFLFNKMC